MAFLMLACTLFSNFKRHDEANTYSGLSVKAAGLKRAISPCWLDMLYILYLTACSFNAPHSTKPIYFPSTD